MTSISDVPEALSGKLKQYRAVVADTNALRKKLNEKSVVIADFQNELEELISKMTLSEIVEFIDLNVRPEIVEFSLPAIEQEPTHSFSVLRLKGIQQVGILIRGDKSTLPSADESGEKKISFGISDDIYSGSFNLVSLYNGSMLKENTLRYAIEVANVTCLIDFNATALVSTMGMIDNIDFNETLSRHLFPWINVR